MLGPNLVPAYPGCIEQRPVSVSDIFSEGPGTLSGSRFQGAERVCLGFLTEPPSPRLLERIGGAGTRLSRVPRRFVRSWPMDRPRPPRSRRLSSHMPARLPVGSRTTQAESILRDGPMPTRLGAMTWREVAQTGSPAEVELAPEPAFLVCERHPRRHTSCARPPWPLFDVRGTPDRLAGAPSPNASVSVVGKIAWHSTPALQASVEDSKDMSGNIPGRRTRRPPSSWRHGRPSPSGILGSRWLPEAITLRGEW